MNITSIQRIAVVLRALVVVVLIALAWSFFALLSASGELSAAELQRLQSVNIATELRNSSNDLTRMARAAVATGQPEYERQYEAVLDIRSGKVPRPIDYHNIYWDLVDINDPKMPRGNTTDYTPLNERLKQLGFTEEELGFITLANARSQSLAEKELVAMNMANGKYANDEGQFVVIGKPNQKRALELVNGGIYQDEKRQVMEPIDKFFDAMNQRVDGLVRTAQTGQRNAQFLFVGLLVVALVLIGLLIFFGNKQAKLELAEREAARQKAEDENEQLNDSVIAILQSVNQLSERDLTVRAPVTEDVIGTVSASINLLSDETAKVLHGVTDIASQVAQVSGNVKSQAEKVSQTAQEERQSVNNMMSSLLEATSTMERVADIAEQSNQSAEAATEVTNNALETVNETVRGMESIRETIAETEKRIKRLGERSQEISGIVNLINTISERTHVLALNASMQAAVAGEAGRGFAVVAEEVQRLAESSRNATQQIGTLVNNIQLETNETINTVNQTIGQVVEGSEQAQKAGEQMQRTQEITAQLVAQVQNIAKASEEQKATSSQLLRAVEQIGEGTEQTAQQIEAQNKETEILQDAAARLVESVNVFKLPPQAAL